MAKKLSAEELLKIELGDFYELADDTVKKKALATIRKKYKAAGQAKAARTTRTTKKAARAACDSPKEKHVGRPRTNPEGSKVWGLRVTDQEREVIKALLDYLRKNVNFDWGFIVSVHHTMPGGYVRKEAVYQKHSDPDDFSMFE